MTGEEPCAAEPRGDVGMRRGEAAAFLALQAAVLWQLDCDSREIGCLNEPLASRLRTVTASRSRAAAAQAGARLIIAALQKSAGPGWERGEFHSQGEGKKGSAKRQQLAGVERDSSNRVVQMSEEISKSI